MKKFNHREHREHRGKRENHPNFSSSLCSLCSLWLIFFLGGCVAIPQKAVNEACATEVEIEETVADAIASSNFEAGSWPSETWWEVFQDEQLNELVLTALANSPTLKEAQSKVARAKEMSLEVRAGLFPYVDFETDLNWQHLSKYGFFRGLIPNGAEIIPPNVYDITLGFDFKYEFDFWGKNRRKFRAALNAMQAEQAESSQSKLMIATSITEAYFHLQTHLTALDYLEKIREDRQALLNLAIARYEEGIDPKMDPLQTIQKILEIEQQLAQIRGEIAQDRHLIAMLAGEGPDSDLGMERASSTFGSVVPLPGQLSTDLLARRPDLMAQIWRLEAAAEEIGIAKTAFYPSLDLSAFAGLETITLSKLFNISSFSGIFHPALHLPIFTAGKLTAQLKTKEAEFDTEIHTYQGILLRAAKEVADQMALITAATDELAFQTKKRMAAEETDRLITSRYEIGVTDALNMLRSHEEVAQLQLKEAELTYKRLTAILMLIKALGGGYHHDRS
jgi:NodT family efflux transporter outer membrane factor (OMF) lipoprotein